MIESKPPPIAPQLSTQNLITVLSNTMENVVYGIAFISVHSQFQTIYDHFKITHSTEAHTHKPKWDYYKAI